MWRWTHTRASLVSVLNIPSDQTQADSFTALADLITEFPSIRRKSHFLFVPGPSDPWSSDVLPRRPIPSAFAAKLMSRLPKTAIFGTNPCRIKYMGQEIVIYRQDLMGKMMRNLVGVKPDLESADLKRYVSLLFRGPFVRS